MNKINWKLRLKNKVTLMALIGSVATIAYNIFAALGITPNISYDELMNAAEAIIGVLVVIGVIADPTTAGLADSAKALNYETPREDSASEEYQNTEYKEA